MLVLFGFSCELFVVFWFGTLFWYLGFWFVWMISYLLILGLFGLFLGWVCWWLTEVGCLSLLLHLLLFLGFLLRVLLLEFCWFLFVCLLFLMFVYLVLGFSDCWFRLGWWVAQDSGCLDWLLRLLTLLVFGFGCLWNLMWCVSCSLHF